MADTRENPVAVPSVAYDDMMTRWDLPIDLLGGTLAMREAEMKWLTQEQGEKYQEYKTRLNRSILYEGYSDTVNKIAARPFSRPITISELPPDLEYLVNDVDTTGKSYETLAQELLHDLAVYGKAHILVDHTRMPDIENGSKLTIRDEKEQGARVLLNRICPTKLIGWQTEKVNGALKLKQIRIKETSIEADEKYTDSAVDFIRVWNDDGTWEQWRKVEGKWVRVEEGLVTGFTGIPLVTIYALQKGFLVAYPPLEGLAWLNLAHWQSSSDQRNILRLSRFAILFGKGFPSEYVEGEKQLIIGPTTAYLTNDENSELKYVEHSGKAIDAGRKDLQDLEMQMEVLGQLPFVKSTQQSTATAKRIDSNRNDSQVQRWIRALEGGLSTALKYACEWRGITPSIEMSVDVFSDFEVMLYGSTDKELLLKIRQAGDLTRTTFLHEEKRRGLLADTVDPEVEAEAAAAEAGEELRGIIDGEADEGISADDGE
jgi:hypothetical protein